MSEPDRYSRQRRLAEIGDAGQARIERATASVRSGDPSAITELSYLIRAGVGAASALPDADAEPFVHASLFRFEAPRAVGAGAWRALGKLRRAVEMDVP